MSARAERGVTRSLAVRVGSAAALVTASVGGLVALDTGEVDAATTLTVDDLSDGGAAANDCLNHIPGRCSLRDALAAATNGDTIDFAPSLFVGGARTLQLNGLHGRLTATRSVSIIGPGATLLAVRADDAYQFRALTVTAGATNVTISGLTFSNGRDGTGAGLRFDNLGTTALEDVVLTGNTATAGGGGAYFNNSGDVTIVDSTVHGNASTSLNGAGLYFRTNGQHVSIVDSTIDGNTAAGSAAALRFGWTNTAVLIANSTITGNSSATGAPAIAHNGGPLTIAQSTITGNTGGLAIRNLNSYTTALTLSGTVVSGNAATDVTMVAAGDVATTVVANGSFIGGVDGRVTLTNPLVGSPNQRGADPKVGALADNGGRTRTMLPLTGSPLLDTGPVPVATFPRDTWDQRGTGHPRVDGPRVDIGAIEVPAPPAPTTTTSTSTTTTTVTPSTTTSPTTAVPVDPVIPVFTG